MLPRRFTRDGAQVVDWEKADERVRELSSQIIYAQIEDCLKTLPAADDMDRAVPVLGGRGGLYRDELSVYRRELSRRLEMRICPTCLK